MRTLRYWCKLFMDEMLFQQFSRHFCGSKFINRLHEIRVCKFFDTRQHLLPVTGRLEGQHPLAAKFSLYGMCVVSVSRDSIGMHFNFAVLFCFSWKLSKMDTQLFQSHDNVLYKNKSRIMCSSNAAWSLLYSVASCGLGDPGRVVTPQRPWPPLEQDRAAQWVAACLPQSPLQWRR
jgi:hypothetical protein